VYKNGPHLHPSEEDNELLSNLILKNLLPEKIESEILFPKEEYTIKEIKRV
jgi:hypothetical protein